MVKSDLKVIEYYVTVVIAWLQSLSTIHAQCGDAEACRSWLKLRAARSLVPRGSSLIATGWIFLCSNT